MTSRSKSNKSPQPDPREVPSRSKPVEIISAPGCEPEKQAVVGSSRAARSACFEDGTITVEENIYDREE